MKKQRRLFALMVSFFLLLSSMNLTAFAEDGEESEQDMITISSDWQGSVFGDIGGQGNITAENFGIVENEDGTVTIRSANNRGKIASSTEGIAYYFQNIPEGANFELSATAHVESWTANNQVSFGIMLRSNVLENENNGSFTGEYVAVGALDQMMKGFYKQESQIKNGLEFNSALPDQGESFPLSIRKSGDLYILTIGNETKTIDEFSGAIHFAGLYTSRNTTVTFSDISLDIEGEVELGDWEFSAFGSNTSAGRNPDPVIEEESVSLFASGGKIASGDEGMSFYYKEIPANTNFELKTKARVKSFNGDSSISTPNQKSFGLMLRDQVGEHQDSSTQTANYVAVGALDQVMKGFYKQEAQTKLDDFENNRLPSANEEYNLTIKKSGSTYVLSSNNDSETITLEDTFTESLFAGFYVARDAEVIFSEMEILVDTRMVDELLVDESAMKTDYLLGESLDLTGLQVAAVYSDRSEKTLTETEYIVTGFDSSTPGTNTITINYNGVMETIDLTIRPLTLTAIEIKYYPAKTVYYPGDEFDPEGFVAIGEYENGYKIEELTADQYVFSILGEEGTGYAFEEPGTTTVTVTSVETSETATSFDVEVKDANITDLEIRNPPEKTLYFLGDELDLDGITIYAAYNDNTEIRLLRNEYTVSDLDTSTSGTKELTISHKGKTATFDVTVKERELTGISVASYPKTTYSIGESLDHSGLEIAKIYDNKDQEILAAEEYTLDSSAFDGSAAGTYELQVIPEDERLQPISFHVTVREKIDYEWQSIRFGQSTSDAKNYVNEGGDGSIELTALEGGGKITGDHDGITFYYTEIDATEDNFVLSADIRVLEYAKNPHDGQESFGIMARDALGTPGDASVFASNIAAVGGYSGGTRNENGTQAFVRTGVESADGAGSKGIQSIMLNYEKPQEGNTHPAAAYKLTLAKTNSGFTVKLNDGQEETFYEPELLNVQDSKIYVGFYTARLATIETSNIEFNVSAAETDAPKVEPPSEPLTPNFEFLSLDKISKTDYSLMLRPNVDGIVTVKQGQRVIAQDTEVQAGDILAIPTNVTAQSNTNFSVTFLPDDTEYLTSYNKIVKNFTVTMKTYRNDGDVYVSPDGQGSGLGTEADPLDLDTAIDFVKEGQKIIVLDGHYVRNTKLEIRKFNDGTAEARKYLVAAPGSRPIIDFDKRSEGVVLSGNYWHVKGIDFTRSAGNTKGFTIGGSYNIVENSRFYENGDTGLQISRTDGSNDKSEWPSHNLILNSTSFDNRDPSDNNADGFAAKLTSGTGNIFRGCIAHNNIDDGWDLYTKVGTGAIGAVLIEDSIAYDNGFLTDGTVGAGDKNGFKLGGEGIHVPHIIRNSMAFGNGAYGFTSNSNPGVIAENNIGFNNAGGNLSFTTYSNIETDFTIDGFVSYQTEHTARDVYPEALNADQNFMFNGSVSVNKSGNQLTDASFVSLEPLTPYERDENGEIIWGDFLKLVQAPAEIKFTPSVLKLKELEKQPKNGKTGPVATVHLKLLDGHQLEDIMLDTIRLNGEVVPTQGKQDKHEYIIKFLRHDLANILKPGSQVPITISGQLKTGQHIQETTHITIK